MCKRSLDVLMQQVQHVTQCVTFSQSSHRYDKTTTHIGVFFTIIYLESWNQGGSIGNKGVWFQEQSQPRWGSSHKFWWNYHIPHVCTALLLPCERWDGGSTHSIPKTRQKSENWEIKKMIYHPNSSNQTHRKLTHGDAKETTQVVLSHRASNGRLQIIQ